MPVRQEDVVTFPALPQYVGAVRSALGDFLAAAGLGDEAAADLKAAVSEACANIVRYAYADKLGNMEIRFARKPGAVAVTVADRGRGFDPDHPPRRSLKDEDIHLGLGLKLMRSLVDELKIRSGASGTVVTLVKKI
ncbi:MAG: ATP-binding protein [Candidatus Margulisbacteria bacterium]|jgi:serine/threonine-protein kinase RsbW|nr:ATP-binding protein [Candidatus Margulisiibacteriota bacterium]